MNYTIEDNIDFFSILKNELEAKPVENTENVCLITHQPLEDTYITLECGHKFNYFSIYNEVINQKNIENYLETTHLLINQLKCPYCRKITNKLLPYIEHPLVSYKKGVNFPLKYCMKSYTCNWIIKSGKRRTEMCGKAAYITNFGTYCCLHQTISYKRNNKKNTNSSSIAMTKKHHDINKKYKVAELKQILRDNKNKVGGTKVELIHRIIQNNLISI